MKRLLLSFVVVLCAALTAMADVVTIDFSTKGYENGKAVANFEQDGIALEFDKGTNNNAPKYYNTGTAVRAYGGNSITVTSTVGNINNIVLTFSSGEGTNEILVDAGSLADGVWTGSASSVKFTVDGTTGHRRFKKMEIYTGDSEYVAPAEPTQKEVSTIAALNALPDGTEFVFNGTAYIADNPSAKHLYLTDAKGKDFTLVYDNAGSLSGYEDEDGYYYAIKPGWTGVVSMYNGLFEVTPTSALEADTETYSSYTPAIVGAEDFVAANMNHIVFLEEVTYTEPEGKNFTITIDGVEVKGYNQFDYEIPTPVEGANYDMYGVISVYGSDVQFQPLYNITENVAYDALGMVDEDEYMAEYDYVFMFEPLDNVNVMVSDRHEITVSNWLGAEGYDIKVKYDSNAGVTSLVQIVDGTESAAPTSDYVNVKIDADNYLGVYMSYSSAYSDPEDMYGYVQLVGYLNGKNLTYYNITWEDGVPTIINGISVAKTVDGAAYNLAGQKVGKEFKGIVISDGKKILKK